MGPILASCPFPGWSVGSRKEMTRMEMFPVWFSKSSKSQCSAWIEGLLAHLASSLRLGDAFQIRGLVWLCYNKAALHWPECYKDWSWKYHWHPVANLEPILNLKPNETNTDILLFIRAGVEKFRSEKRLLSHQAKPEFTPLCLFFFFQEENQYLTTKVIVIFNPTKQEHTIYSDGRPFC